MDNNEMTTNENKGYLVLAEYDIGKAMAEELAGMDVDFERIKMPSGGSTFFEIPSIEQGGSEAVKELSAVILHHHALNVYYQGEYDGGGSPPDCISYDGRTGVGNPGGSCETCPFNEFGSGRNDGKACQNRRRVFILREGEVLPMLLSIPSTSLKAFNRYVQFIVAKRGRSNHFVTKFTLIEAVNKTNTRFSKVQCAKGRNLSPEELDLIGRLSGQIEAHSQNVRYTAEEAEDEGPMIDPETGEIIRALT